MPPHWPQGEVALFDEKAIPHQDFPLGIKVSLKNRRENAAAPGSGFHDAKPARGGPLDRPLPFCALHECYWRCLASMK
jgi:hypothetical protein